MNAYTLKWLHVIFWAGIAGGCTALSIMSYIAISVGVRHADNPYWYVVAASVCWALALANVALLAMRSLESIEVRTRDRHNEATHRA